MVRKINNRLYKINTYASEMIVEVDDNYDEEVQKLKKEIQLDSLGCKLNLLVYLAELSVQGYAISSVTEFNSNGTKPRVATVYKGNNIKINNGLPILRRDTAQTRLRGGIFVAWQERRNYPTGA